MRSRGWWLAVGLVLGAACEREVDLQVRWLSRLSYREIAAIVPMPDGGVAIAGHSLSEEMRAQVGFGQSTFRPFVARLRGDGTAAWSELGYLGGAHAIAADEDGSVYVVTTAREDLYGHACDLVAHAPDGAVRWSRPVDVDGDCPTKIAAFDDRLFVVRELGTAIDVLDRDGTPVSRLELPDGEHLDRLLASSSALWAFGGSGWWDTERVLAWRVPSGARGLEAVELADSEGWGEISAAGVREDGIDVVQVKLDVSVPYDPSRVQRRFVAYDADGRRRHSIDLTDANGSIVAIVADPQGGAWLIGSTSVDAPSLESPTERIASGRIWARRVGPRGELGPQTTRWFAEPAGDAPERVECIASDAGPSGVHGTHATFAVPGADGTIVIAGTQHCRDAWVAAFEVR